MVFMQKGEAKRFVPDSLVDLYKRNGYVPVGSDAPAAEADTNASAPDATGDSHLTPDDAGDTASADTGSDAAGDEDKFTCPHCGKKYASKAVLDKHIETKHGQK